MKSKEKIYLLLQQTFSASALVSTCQPPEFLNSEIVIITLYCFANCIPEQFNVTANKLVHPLFI